jgi:hypothetical protein
MVRLLSSHGDLLLLRTFGRGTVNRKTNSETSQPLSGCKATGLFGGTEIFHGALNSYKMLKRRLGI